jgi:hypothetical protein
MAVPLLHYYYMPINMILTAFLKLLNIKVLCQGIEKVYQGVVKWFHHLQIKQTIFCVHLML